MQNCSRQVGLSVAAFLCGAFAIGCASNTAHDPSPAFDTDASAQTPPGEQSQPRPEARADMPEAAQPSTPSQQQEVTRVEVKPEDGEASVQRTDEGSPEAAQPQDAAPESHSATPSDSDPQATEAPATDAPASDAPATDAPAGDGPASDAPAQDPGATNAPANDGATGEYAPESL